MNLRERLARQPPGYNFTIGRILAIYAGLMVTLLLAALDQTIVATALPRIVSDLGGLQRAAATILGELKHQYRLGYDPPRGPSEFRRVEVQSTRKGVLVKTRSGYVPRT